MIPVGGNGVIQGFAGASPAASTGVALGNVTIVSLPERLMALARPFTITATGAGQRGENIVILRTQYGQVLIEADFSVPANRPLSLTIGVGNPPLKGQLTLMTLPGKGEATAPPTTVAGGGSASPAVMAAELKPGAIVRAMTVGPSSSETMRPLPAPSSFLPVAADLAANASRARALPPVSETAWRVLQAPLIAQSAAETQPPRSAPALPLPASAQPASGVALRILQIVPPPSASNAAIAAESAVARVVNTSLAGQPIVQWNDEVLVLETQQRLPKGTLLFIERALPSAPAAGDSDPTIAPRGGSAWSGLGDVLSALARAELPAVVAIRPQLQPGHPQFSGTLLFLMAALRLGDPKVLLGERGIEALTKSGRGELIERLREAARKSAAPMLDHHNGEWRSQMVPVGDGEAIAPLQVAFRRVDDAGGEETAQEERRSHRFLIDFAPSQLGMLQLEGLVDDKRFDLVMRSERPFPPALAAELKDAFARGLEEAGLGGVLTVKVESSAFIRLRPTRDEVGLVA